MAPDQSPEAQHAVALIDDHLKVVEVLKAIKVESALRSTVGGGSDSYTQAPLAQVHPSPLSEQSSTKLYLRYPQNPGRQRKYCAYVFPQSSRS